MNDAAPLAGTWTGMNGIKDFWRAVTQLECLLDEDSLRFEETNGEWRLRVYVSNPTKIDDENRRLFRVRAWVTVYSVDLVCHTVAEMTVRQSQGIGLYYLSTVSDGPTHFQIQCAEKMSIKVVLSADPSMVVAVRSLGPRSGYVDRFLGVVETGLKILA